MTMTLHTGRAPTAVTLLLAALALSPPCLAQHAAPQGKIAFSSNRDGTYDLYIANADGTAPRSLAPTMMDNETHPTWSPDGTQIAFEVEGSRIAIVSADGSGRREFCRGRYPAWSPDGTQIAFADARRGTYEIHIATLDGNTRRLTSTIADEANPAWSPDGKRLAFQRTRVVGPTEIWLIDADGTGAGFLTRGGDPAWSPDGKLIAFVADEYGRRDLYVIDPTGESLRRLTNDDWIERGPSWSPDGKWIAFSRQPGGRDIRFTGRDQEIVVMNAEGGGRERLTMEWRSQCVDPAWRPQATTPDAEGK